MTKSGPAAEGLKSWRKGDGCGRGRSVVKIPAQHWDEFRDWAESPAKEVPALRRLAAIPPEWQVVERSGTQLKTPEPGHEGKG